MPIFHNTLSEDGTDRVFQNIGI